MPRFVPLSNADPLPLIGSAAEHALWDLKREPTNSKYELAKDVAALANHFGGTILIGAQEYRGHIQSYFPHPVETIQKIESDISSAVDSRCSPRPTLNFARFNEGGGCVLAVNVWPNISNICGVKVKTDKSSDTGTDSWVFPVRIANQTGFVKPESFSMYMLPELRRTLLLLYAIPSEANIIIFQNGNTLTSKARIIEIREDTNSLIIAKDSLRPRQVVSFPLDSVRNVYKDICNSSGVEEVDESTLGWRIYINV